MYQQLLEETDELYCIIYTNATVTYWFYCKRYIIILNSYILL